MVETKMNKLSGDQKADLLLGLTGGFRIKPWYVVAGVSVASIAGLVVTVRWSFSSLVVRDLSTTFC